MNLHHENEDGFVDARYSRDQDFEWNSLIETAHVQRIIARSPRIEAFLSRALSSSIMQDALVRALRCTDGELARNLENDLTEAFPGLGGGVPKTVEDLDTREVIQRDPAATDRTVEEMKEVRLDQRTGGAADYLAQRMMAVSGLLDFGKSISLFPALEVSLHREADRVATLLTAFDRAERAAEQLSQAAAAK